MAATAWTLFNNFKRKLGEGAIDLTGATTTFKMILLTSAGGANVTAGSFSTYASIQAANKELTTDNGYVSGGKTLVNPNWSVKTTTSSFTWTFDTVVFTAAAGSAMTDVGYALVMTQTASIPIMYTKLSTAAITVAAGQEYHIYPNPVAFEMTST